ncbi:MAG: sigma-70 family RNA polymerase sigma factor [Myxococcales bacterium]|nr:sigma-70 family RNA polymerase sigma factor [Myxococcales bacterium]
MPPLHDPGAAHLSARPIDDEGDELDRRLLARAAQGDRRAFDELVERHSDALFRFLRMLLHRDEAAEDALQETWIAVHRAAADYRGEGRFVSWLFTIARHRALRQLDARPTTPVDEASLDTLGLEAGWGEPGDPESLASEAERAERLRAALEALGAEDRAVLVLHDLEGLSGPESAEVLGLSLAATKSRLHRARLRLLAELRSRGVRDARS